MIKFENVVLTSPEQMEFIIEGMRNPMNVGFLFHCIKKIDTHILQLLICKKRIKTIKEELYYVKRKNQRKGKEWS